MSDNQVDLKDPVLAAILAFLVPGLGHLYQRRYFKAAVYSICIISLYIYGMSLSHWRIVEYRGGPREPRTELLRFVAQSGVGLPGMFAFLQSQRYQRSDSQLVTSLQEPLSAPFVGTIDAPKGDNDLQGPVSGVIELAPTVGPFEKSLIMGKVNAALPDGRKVNLTLGEGVRLGPVLRNDPRRVVEGDIVRREAGREIEIGRLTEASIPRSFWNWFAVPLTDQEEQELHRELGKFHELALVFTMIAGLLNILAVWDAYDGPAYGYGSTSDSEADEHPARRRSAPSSQETVTAGAGS